MSELPVPSPAPAALTPALVEATPNEALDSAVLAAQERFTVRVWCTFIFVLSVSMLGMGLYLTPSADGVGTHQELHLPPCGWLSTLGFPCPTCGCTTAVSYFSHGHPIRSFLTQPFGFVVGLLGAVLLPLTLMGIGTGRWIGPSMFWLGWHWRYWVFGTVGILALAWVYKIIIYRQHLTF